MSILRRTIEIDNMVDLRGKHLKQVEIKTNHDGTTLWVNVDNECALRIVGMRPGTIKLDLNHPTTVVDPKA